MAWYFTSYFQSVSSDRYPIDMHEHLLVSGLKLDWDSLFAASMCHIKFPSSASGLIAQKCGCPHFHKQHPTDSQLRFPNAWLRPSSCRHRNQMLQHAADCLIRMFGTQNRRRWSLETDDIPQVLRNSKSMNLVETCQTCAAWPVEHWSALTAWCYNAVGHDVTWISQNRCRRIRVDVAMSSKNLYQLGTNRKTIRDVKSFGIDLAQDLLFLQLSTWAAVVLSKFRSWSLLRESRIWLVVSCIYINVQICCQRFSSSLKLAGDPQWSIMNCNYIYIII
jgi:hypothetical protein